jgi:HK97 family phage major capsid protein
MMNVAEMKHAKNELIVRAREIHEGAEKEQRDLEAAELGNFEQLRQDALALDNRIKREEDLLAMTSGASGGSSEPRAFQAQGEGDLGSGASATEKVRASEEFRSAFRRWMRFGNSGLTQAEQRALSSVDANGGYMMAPLQVANDLIVAINNRLFIRQLSTKLTIEANAKSLGVPTIATDPSDPDWTAEVAAIQEDTSMAFGRRDLTPYLLTKFLKVSNKLLRSVSNVESVINDRLAYKFAVAIEKACMTGTGATGPLGIFVADANGIPAASDVATASATAIAFDDLVKVKYSLPQQYWAKAQWVINPTVGLTLALVKEAGATGQYIWRESTRVGEPSTLLGHAVNLSAYAPNTVTTGLYTAILGDFSFYWMVDSLNFQLKRLDELYAINSQTGFIGQLEMDGAPVLGDAFRRMKQA